MTRYPTTPPDDDDAWAWLDQPTTSPDLHLIPGEYASAEFDEPYQPPSREDRWLVALPDTPDAADTGTPRPRWAQIGTRLPGAAWAALGAAIAALALAAALALPTADTDATGEQVRATAAPPSPTPVSQEPCTGLSGTVVTERSGDRTTVAGVIAAFEAAYYVLRDAAQATALLAPEAGIKAEDLAAGIATIPAGTRHCVAITPISPSTANVHIAELRPDRTRIDYLQLINTRPADGTPAEATAPALVISNVQRAG
ncbi:hypothetical protein ACWDYH_38350 [Nocardia goodfellowii]